MKLNASLLFIWIFQWRGKKLTWHQWGKFNPQFIKYPGRALLFPYYVPFELYKTHTMQNIKSCIIYDFCCFTTYSQEIYRWNSISQAVLCLILFMNFIFFFWLSLLFQYIGQLNSLETTAHLTKNRYVKLQVYWHCIWPSEIWNTSSASLINKDWLSLLGLKQWHKSFIKTLWFHSDKIWRIK